MDSRKHHGVFGRVGIWSSALKTTGGDTARHKEVIDAVGELEELGYGALWLGASPAVADAAALVDATERIAVATGILSIWNHAPEEVAAQVADVEARAPGRFFLGMGVSHSALTPRYARPYSAMVAYLDALDAARPPVAPERRLLAALGPRMLELSADRTLGAHPYLVTTGYVAQARAVLGPGALLAPELMVVPDMDLERGRATARGVLEFYLRLPNYIGNLLRLGFTEADFDGGGSDRLLDELFALGGTEQATARIAAYLEAGADHVAVQLLAHDGPREALPREQWRELAAALSLR